MSLFFLGSLHLLTVSCRSTDTNLLTKNGAILKGPLFFTAPCGVRIGLDWGYILGQLLHLPNPIPNSPCNRMGKQTLRKDSGAGAPTSLLTMRTPTSLREGTKIVPGPRKHAVVRCFAVVR